MLCEIKESNFKKIQRKIHFILTIYTSQPATETEANKKYSIYAYLPLLRAVPAHS